MYYLLLIYITLFFIIYFFLILFYFMYILICNEIRENSEWVVGYVEQDTRILFNNNYWLRLFFCLSGHCVLNQRSQRKKGKKTYQLHQHHRL